jgi:hypothetical protein
MTVKKIHLEILKNLLVLTPANTKKLVLEYSLSMYIHVCMDIWISIFRTSERLDRFSSYPAINSLPIISRAP